MTGFPILDRELSVRSRSWRTHAWRMVLTVAGAVAVLGLLQAGSLAGRSPVTLGETLFQLLSLLGVVYCLLAGPVLTADCLSNEKRQGTLPLLYLSNLPSTNIVLGKLVACSLPAFYALFAFLPVLALPFFLGGITPGEFWRTSLLLASLLAGSIALCGLISALSWSGRKALAASAGLLFAWCCLPWIWTITGRTMPWAGGFPDPLNFWLAALDQQYSADPGSFRLRLTVCWLGSLACLSLAILVTPRLLESPIRTSRPPRRFPLNRPRSQRQIRSRERWYDLNPVAWVARQRTPVRTPILIFTGLFGTMTLGAAFFGDRLMRRPDLFLAAIFSLHALLKLWLAWELSRCLSRDQAEGLLEPLLAAPLSEHQIVHGWITGLQTVFRWPVILLLAMDLAVWNLCDLEGLQYPLFALMGMVVFDAFTLLWAGLYFGLTAPNAIRGLLRTIGVVLVAPWMIGLGFLTILSMARLQWLLPATSFVLCLLWLGMGVLVDASLCFHCSRKLGGNFRHLVAEKT